MITGLQADDGAIVNKNQTAFLEDASFFRTLDASVHGTTMFLACFSRDM